MIEKIEWARINTFTTEKKKSKRKMREKSAFIDKETRQIIRNMGGEKEKEMLII